jgi:apolipoprotein N-acyltransferase
LTVLALCFAVTPALWRLGLRRWAVFFVILPFVLGGFGGVRLFLNPPAGTQGAKKIRLVQPAIPQAEKWDRAKRAQNFKHIVRISASQKPIPQLTIWPETAFSAFASRDGSLLKAMAMQTLPFDGVLITGLPRLDEDNRQFNSAALINPRGEIKSIYDKQRLVPFGEFAPFRRFLPFVDVIAGPTDFTAGTGNRLFDVPGYGKVRVLICYESIFSGDIVKGGTRPDLIVNITNDAWFGRTLGPWQHLAQARMRSVEEGVPVMRVANTGISAGFDAYGRSLGHIGLEKADVIDFAVPAPAPITFFARANHSSLFLGVLLLGLLARRLDQTKLMGH